MEPIPARILRPFAQSCFPAPKLTPREARTYAYILEAARAIFARHGVARITMREFATAINVAPSTIRRHVCDMHYLFRLVLTAHLDMILAGISAVPAHHGDRQARSRAEYHRLTRDHLNRITPVHALLVRHRFALPDDQLDPLEDHRRMIGVILGGDTWDLALQILDCAPASLAQVEVMLAAARSAAPASGYASEDRSGQSVPAPTMLDPAARAPSPSVRSLFTRAVSAQPVPAQPFLTRPVSAQLVSAQPVPVQPVSVQAGTTQAVPVQAISAKPGSAEAIPVQAAPARAASANGAPTRAAPAHPAPAHPTPIYRAFAQATLHQALPPNARATNALPAQPHAAAQPPPAAQPIPAALPLPAAQAPRLTGASPICVAPRFQPEPAPTPVWDALAKTPLRMLQ